jgi:FkbM family methyltransferase
MTVVFWPPAAGWSRRIGTAGRHAGGTAGFIWAHPAVRGARVRALARYVGWQAWQRLVRRPVTIRLPGDVRMRCHPHSPAASAMLYCGLPEWESMRFVLDYLRPGDVFVDVGANVGGYTLLAGGVAGVRVVAFEPASATFPRLLENVRLNPWLAVETRRAAVGDVDDAGVLFTRDLDTVNHVVAGPGDGQDRPRAAARVAVDVRATPDEPTELVPMVRLDSVLAGVRVAVIKIDVEGFEPAVLAGARALIRERRPALVVEWNDPVRLGELFAEVGYVSCRYLPDAGLLEPIAWSGAPGPIQNVIAVPAEQLGAAGRLRSAAPTVGSTVGSARPEPRLSAPSGAARVGRAPAQAPARADARAAHPSAQLRSGK